MDIYFAFFSRFIFKTVNKNNLIHILFKLYTFMFVQAFVNEVSGVVKMFFNLAIVNIVDIEADEFDVG